MYDREVISRSIVSPIGSGATYEEVRDSIIEGFEQKVRSIVVAPFHVELLHPNWQKSRSTAIPVRE